MSMMCAEWVERLLDTTQIRREGRRIQERIKFKM